jgi:hypothetical protein
MNPFELLMVIGVAIIVFVLLRAKHFSAMSNGPREPDDTPDRRGREAELEREVKELRERVKVLERITVDGRDTRRLSDEIEKLRDE